MSTRKDPEIQEDIKRGAENEQGSAGIDSRNNNYNDDDGPNPSDKIKNANAAGLGAIGRNDQRQTGYTSDHTSDGEKG